MRKSTYSIMAAALLMTGALLTTACSTEEEAAIDSTMPGADSGETIQFTATLAPKDGDAQTRSITAENQGTASETLNVAWKAGEQIAIYYETTSGHKTAPATVGTPNPDGSAPITATLTDAKDNGDAKFVYPYSLTEDGELNTGSGSAFRTQNGTIEYISQNLDAATATGTIDVTGQTATVSGTISLANQVCICKFSFSGLSTDEDENYYDITIREKQQDGTKTKNTYVAPNIAKASMGAVYMALLGANGKDFTFSVQGNYKSSATAEAEKRYSYDTSSTEVTLVAGKFYRSIPVAVHLSPISGNNPKTVTIPAGMTLMLDGATISVADGPGIQCKGDATIILTGTNSVTTSAEEHPAIFIPADKTLTIQGTGSLTAESSEDGGAAGIGSGKAGTCGNITIESGTVTAISGGKSAGIGGGFHGTCGAITINGGTVTATGNGSAAGIGGGYQGTCGAITINGGTVTAKSDGSGAGIGSGRSGSCGDITINGGSVTAESPWGAAGIGSGQKGKFTSINITNGITTVTATAGSSQAAPIGKGEEDAGSGTVTIDDKTSFTFTTSTDQFEHFNSTISNDGKTWTLTKK